MEKLEHDSKDIMITLLNFFKEREAEIPRDEIASRWLEIERRVAMRRRWSAIIYAASVAAAVALLFTVFVPRSVNVVDESAGDIVSFASSVPAISSDKLVCVVPGCDLIEVEGSHASVSCGPDGEIAVGDAVVSSGSDAGGVNDYCRLIVPGGKRAELTLPDGSRIWANSRTSIIYPREFASDHREIYVTGEVYAEISPDRNRPFTVLTGDFCVKVLGTSFNIMAYDADSVSQVVLVTGRIDLTDNVTGSTAALAPGDMAEVSSAGVMGPVKVDVEPYISWINDILICRDEPLGKVCRRLWRCYDREFVVDPSAADINVTGKLYLKEDINDVLHTISYSTSVEFVHKNGKIYVTVPNR
ncbi:MAG: FecR domain-containing protein [Muribaculaceae bacterium]|nr:FecR domain-containing protein [Muribaculaceae bacterium]